MFFKKIPKFILECLPIILLAGIYINFARITKFFERPDYDWLLVSIDKFLFFGTQPSFLLEKFISPSLTEYMNFSYGFYIFLFPITLGLFYFQRKYQAFYSLRRALIIAIMIGFAFYLAIPANGPYIIFKDFYSIELQGGYITKAVQQLLDLFLYNRGEFPSLHVALTTIILFFSYKYSRKLFAFYLLLIPSLWCATLYLRYHYFVDVIAGFLLAFFAIWLSLKIQNSNELKKRWT
jgi:membrane-associated phospholipid phosphatase